MWLLIVRITSHCFLFKFLTLIIFGELLEKSTKSRPNVALVVLSLTKKWQTIQSESETIEDNHSNQGAPMKTISFALLLWLHCVQHCSSTSIPSIRSIRSSSISGLESLESLYYSGERRLQSIDSIGLLHCSVGPTTALLSCEDKLYFGLMGGQ